MKKYSSLVVVIIVFFASCEKLKDFFPPDKTDCQGKALQFDGVDDYVNVGERANLKIRAELTMEAWIYPTGNGSGDYEGGMIMNREGEYEVARFGDGTIRIGTYDPILNNDWINSGYKAPLNKWTHIAVTYSTAKSIIVFYANGAKVFSTPASGEIQDRSPDENDFRIGARQIPYRKYHYFDGVIDEVRVWNAALSQRVIQEWRDKTITSTHPNYNNLQGYWKMDEDSGTVTADASGHHDDGQLINGPQWVTETRNCGY